LAAPLGIGIKFLPFPSRFKLLGSKARDRLNCFCKLFALHFPGNILSGALASSGLIEAACRFNIDFLGPKAR